MDEGATRATLFCNGKQFDLTTDNNIEKVCQNVNVNFNFPTKQKKLISYSPRSRFDIDKE